MVVIGVGQEKENDVLMRNATFGQRRHLRRFCEESSTGAKARLPVSSFSIAMSMESVTGSVEVAGAQHRAQRTLVIRL